MTQNPFEPSPEEPNEVGLTRLQLHCMTQRLSLLALSEVTRIPRPTLSQYANGHRRISARHLRLLEIALQATDLQGYCTSDDISIDPHEWSDDNPYPLVHKSKHSWPHNAPIHKYEMV